MVVTAQSLRTSKNKEPKRTRQSPGTVMRTSSKKQFIRMLERAIPPQFDEDEIGLFDIPESDLEWPL
jgi:hypothetical protein